MPRKSVVIAVAVAVVLMLGAWACGGGADGKSDPDTRTTGSAPKAATSYDTFLAVLAENGWVPTEDQKLIGSPDGVEVTVRHCAIRLALTKVDALDYQVTSVNGFGPEYFGNESESRLGKENITRSDFESALADLQDRLGVIEPC